MLLAKNQSYGNSALDPVRIFSKANAGEQLLVRIDDKLSRIMRGNGFPGDDDLLDLVGYLHLEMVRRKMGAKGVDAATSQGYHVGATPISNCSLCGEFRGHGHECGWREWTGSTSNWPSDLDGETRVKVRFKDGQKITRQARTFGWFATGSSADIIAYKPETADLCPSL